MLGSAAAGRDVGHDRIAASVGREKQRLMFAEIWRGWVEEDLQKGAEGFGDNDEENGI